MRTAWAGLLAITAGLAMAPPVMKSEQSDATKAAAAAPATEDDRIFDQVRMKLASDQDVKGGALDVVVKNGVVVIKGRVDTEKGRNKATRLAKRVKGVKSVENDLSVGPPA